MLCSDVCPQIQKLVDLGQTPFPQSLLMCSHSYHRGSSLSLLISTPATELQFYPVLASSLALFYPHPGSCSCFSRLPDATGVMF